MTQGGPLLAKLFNIMVDAVVREWIQQLRVYGEYDEKGFAEYMATFFTIFHVDDAYFASWDAEFLQYALTHLVHLFKRAGLQTNTTKTQMIIYTPGRIRMQLSMESYRRMQQGQVSASKWNSCTVECQQCGKVLKASSLGHHLADVHDIYQQALVAEELLEDQPPVLYTVCAELHTQALPCPYPGCIGQLRDGWMMGKHFRNVHPMDLVKVPKEGRFDRCERCGMQVHPLYPCHPLSNKCQVGVERQRQREAAVTAALALCQQFTIHGNVLERVEVYKYLGRMMAQDDDDTQAIRAQLRKARATWARVGKVLRGENTSPTIAAKFYLAVVQAVLLYSSKTWVISPQAMARLEGFHIRAAWRMAQRHKPRRGPGKEWVYPKSEDVLKEWGMKTIAEYVQIRWQTIVVYIATRPIL